jgi:hypothetical protein
MTQMMPRSRAWGILAFTVLIAGFADAGAQAPETANAAPPVTLYLRAANADGDPVTDLAGSDVTVRIGGQPRAVRSMQLLDFRQAAASPATAQASGWPPPFATNETTGGGGRDLIIAIDDASLSPASVKSLQESLTQLLDGVSPRDRVGLMSVRGGGVNIGLTARQQSVRAAVASLTAQGGATEPCRSSAILETLKNLISSLKGASPATVVFFSTGAQPDQCGVRMEEWRPLGAAVERTFTAFYIAQVFEGSGARSGFLDSLAGMGGGELLRLTGETSRQMARIIRETQVAYRLLVEPDPRDRNGTTQRLELRTARAGLKLSVPGSVTFGPTSSTSSKPATPAELLRGAVPPSDLRLRAAAFPSRNPGDDKTRVVVMFEPIDPAAKIASAAVAMFDEREQPAAQWTARRSDLARAPVLTALPVPPGVYRLRVAATDANGHAGAVDVNVDARLVEGKALKLSSIVLGAIQDGALSPRLQFGAEPSAVAYLEIYGTAAGTLSARFEIATSAPGAALPPVEAQVRRMTSDDAHSAQALIPVATLPAGDTLIRAVVSINGTPAAQVTRTLRKQ